MPDVNEGSMAGRVGTTDRALLEPITAVAREYLSASEAHIVSHEVGRGPLFQRVTSAAHAYEEAIKQVPRMALARFLAQPDPRWMLPGPTSTGAGEPEAPSPVSADAECVFCGETMTDEQARMGNCYGRQELIGAHKLSREVEKVPPPTLSPETSPTDRLEKLDELLAVYGRKCRIQQQYLDPRQPRMGDTADLHAAIDDAYRAQLAVISHVKQIVGALEVAESRLTELERRRQLAQSIRHTGERDETKSPEEPT